MPFQQPAHDYYRAVEGRWHGPVDFRITDFEALATSPLRPIDRLGVRFVASLGTLGIRTRVWPDPHLGWALVHHSTRVDRWGLPLMASRESIAIDELTGQAMMNVVLRTAPFWWPASISRDGAVRVAEDGNSARYELLWLGAPMQQHAVHDPHAGTVTLTQTTSFSHSRQVLRRTR